MNMLKPGRVALFFAFAVLASQMPILFFPYHWDSLPVLAGAKFIQQHHLVPLPGPHDYGHPPFFQILLALLWSVSGSSLWMPRLAAAALAFTAVFFTYLCGREIRDGRTGIIAAAALFLSPFFFAQAGIPSMDLALTALASVVFFAALKDNVALFIVAGSCMVLTKASGLIVFLCCFFFLIGNGFRKEPRMRRGRAVLSAIPAYCFLGWLVFHAWAAGWAFYPREFSFSASTVALRFSEWIRQFFFSGPLFFSPDPLRMRPSTFAIVSAVLFTLAAVATCRRERRLLPAFASIGCYLLALSLYSEALPRYLLVIYPFLYLIGAWWLTEAVPDARYATAAAALAICISFPAYDRHRGLESTGSGALLETNREYLDVVATHAQAARFIETEYPRAKVFTSWPQSDELSEPAFGYVRAPVKYLWFSFLDTASPGDLVYYSPQAHQSREMGRRMREKRLKLLRSFERNGKSAAVYQVLETTGGGA